MKLDSIDAFVLTLQYRFEPVICAFLIEPIYFLSAIWILPDVDKAIDILPALDDKDGSNLSYLIYDAFGWAIALIP